jgi:4-aminobutyrate aminotransferase-like enzyme
VCATLDVFEEEKVVAHARRAAKWLRRGLDTLQKQFPFILEVRGEGLVFGLDMADTVTADACVLEAYRARPKRGVHFLGPLAGKVLRVSPPLTITRDEVDEAVEMLAAAWSRVG